MLNDVSLASNGVYHGEGIIAVDALRMLRGLVEEGLMPVDVVAYEWDQAPRVLADG